MSRYNRVMQEISYSTSPGLRSGIWDQMEGKVDAFVAGVGSGGTIGGVGKYLKERNPRVRIIAVEPKQTAALLRQEPGLHAIQGIGDGFVPPVLDTQIIDDLMTVSDEDAIESTRELARKQGLLAGLPQDKTAAPARDALAPRPPRRHAPPGLPRELVGRRVTHGVHQKDPVVHTRF
jgi:cysteine synthase